MSIVSGPWVIGEMMHGHLGALFVHGMYLKKQWIPGSLTYYYGIMQVRKKAHLHQQSVFFCRLKGSFDVQKPMSKHFVKS